MSRPRTRVPAIEGWFTMDEEAPTLIGSRCRACGGYAFPPARSFCANPACTGSEFDEVPLSRTGTIWSYTDARYQPPPPYVAADPYVPFALAAVELAAEKMVVMGRVAPGVALGDLVVGAEVTLVLGTLYADEEHEYLVWNWEPTGARAGGPEPGLGSGSGPGPGTGSGVAGGTPP